MISPSIPCPDFRVTSNGTVFRIERKLIGFWLFGSSIDWLPLGQDINGKFKVFTFYTEEGAVKAMVECQKERNAKNNGWDPV